MWERIDQGEAVRVLLSVPPRHGKSETTLHGLAWYLGRHPDRRCIYTSYGTSFAQDQSYKARRYAVAAGVQLAEDSRRVGMWQTTAYGGVLATGAGGGITGYGADGVIIIDDPLKDRQEAESPTRRHRIWDWFTDVINTRPEGNCSVIVVMTRWHPDDLVGRLLKGASEWENICIPAIAEDPQTGERRALAPQLFDLDALDAIRQQSGEYTWASLYQGQPRPRGGALFGPPTTCAFADLPTHGQDTIGFDLAYTAKTHADYSVAVVLRRYESKNGLPLFWVTDLLRRQCPADQFVELLRGLAGRHPGASLRWHCSTTERGLADVMRGMGLNATGVLARADKFTRALPLSAAWNDGRIIVPRDAPWSSALLDELASFTGVADAHDDQVDALASAFDAMPTGTPGQIRTGPERATFGLGDAW